MWKKALMKIFANYEKIQLRKNIPTIEKWIDMKDLQQGYLMIVEVPLLLGITR